MINGASIVVAPGAGALAAATVDTAYQQLFSASGGIAPYSFAIGDGSLPPGMALASDGTLSGTPTVDGVFEFTVLATDAFGQEGSSSYSIAVSAAALPDPTGAPAAADGSAPLPYRRYRSSGGLEIRVGRGAKRNDELTFRHSAPDDIWLHARDAAGAHVILRWPHAGNPPRRDLEEAAVLAALGSRARTSGSVPVDWARRKHVRKPRKSPPGLVIPSRVQTLFVHPDRALEARLGQHPALARR